MVPAAAVLAAFAVFLLGVLAILVLEGGRGVETG